MTENAALQLVQQWDEADSISIQAQNRLRATGKTFRTYRNAQCGFVANLGGVTRQRELENDQMACIYHFNVDRTNHLTEVLSEIRRR